MANFAFVPVEAILAKSEIKVEDVAEQDSNLPESFIDFENDDNRLEQTEIVHQNERFDCDFCDLGFWSKADMDFHIQESHVETTIKTEVCDDMEIQQDVKNLR